MNNHKDIVNNERADLFPNNSELVLHATKIVKEELELASKIEQSNIITRTKEKTTQFFEENYQRQTTKWKCVKILKASIEKSSRLTFTFTLDSKTLISSDNCVIQVWNLQTGNLNHEINVKDIVDSRYKSSKIIISSNSLCFAYFIGDIINVYCLSTAKLTHSLVCSSENVFDISFSPDGRTIAIIGSVSKLWNIYSGEEPYLYEDFFAISLDWNIFTTFDYPEDYNQVIKIKDLQTNKNINSIYIGYEYSLLTLPILSASGRFISYSGIYKQIFSNDQNFTQIWDSYTGKTLYKLTTSNEIKQVIFSLNEKLFAVTLWNEPEKQKIVEIRTTLNGEIVNTFNINEFDDIEISLDGQNLIVSNIEEIKIWHFMSKKLLYTFTSKNRSHKKFDKQVFSSDEQTLAIGCSNGEIMILQQNNDSLVEVAEEPISEITGEKFVIGGTATWFRTNSNGDVDLFIERVIILAISSEHIVIEANIDGQKIVYFALPEDLGFKSPIKIEQFEVKP